MKRIFLDTNIVIDLLSARAPYYLDVAIIFSAAERNEIELYLSSLTIANTSYILLKQNNLLKVKTLIRNLMKIVKTLPLDDRIIELALNDNNFDDFEDSLQYYTALDNKLDLIVTRNKKDFKNSKILTMTAKEYLER